MRRMVIMLSLVAIPVPAQAAAGDAPLFDSDQPLEVTLGGPIPSLVRNAARSTTPRPGTLAAAGASHAVTIAPRGLSRRQADVCDFPPLRISFLAKPEVGSPFAGQRKLKLVTHCRNNDRGDALVLREYGAYRLYNLMTPASFKVRLANVRYVDESGRQVARRHGFFIEDIDDVAKRVGGHEVKLNGIARGALDAEAATRVALFQYMIGNLDWTFLRSPAGDSCCHNSKLLANEPERPAAAIPIPYDFDYSGLVDAPYAVVPEGISARSIKQRRYFGLCPHNGALPAQAAAFRAARPALEAELGRVPDLPPSSLVEMKSYLAGFFDDIRDDRAVQERLAGRCR